MSVICMGILMKRRFCGLAILLVFSCPLGCVHSPKTELERGVQGVTYIGGAGAGGADANITSRTVNYSPAAGHAIIASAYTCYDSNCFAPPTTTMAISDNKNSPETCFAASPHSPFALNETSMGKQQLQEYIWVCPSIPSGVTSFTITCSVAKSCSFMTLTVTDWTGLAASNVFDVDGGAASTVRQTTATIPTSSPTRFTNELLYTFLDNTGDETMSAVSPYAAVLQFWPGNINTAALIASPGPQTAQTTWTRADDWYGAIVAIKSASSVLATGSASSSQRSLTNSRLFGLFPPDGDVVAYDAARIIRGREDD